jgi:hypothetical protein
MPVLDLYAVKYRGDGHNSWGCGMAVVAAYNHDDAQDQVIAHLYRLYDGFVAETETPAMLLSNVIGYEYGVVIENGWIE